MASGPLSNKLDWALANSKWANALNPLLTGPLAGFQILPNIVLVAGANVIPHKLGRLQQGWFLVDQQGSFFGYRSAPFNTTTLTLTLPVDSPNVPCSIGVF